jgi:polyphosphate kinase
MKIKIKTDDVKFTIRLPLATIKTKFFWKMISDNEYGIDEEESHHFACMIYKELKKFRKKYGGFVLLDINTEEGELVQIIV